MRFSSSGLFPITCVLLLTCGVFGQVLDFDFITFDDASYVFGNPHLAAGLSGRGIAWAFTSTYFSNWHPLTWITLLADQQIFGLNPGGYHLTNLIFHLLGTAILFLALRRLTHAPGRSAFVAALFALHPLHVESVAWVSERKDVLSGVLAGLTLLSYARYCEQPGSVRRYLPVGLFLALGLMAKPMLVTLPCVLLLLDFWPLGRMQGADPEILVDRSRVLHLLWEKVPLFALSLASAVITFRVQHAYGSVATLGDFPFHLRAGNAILSGLAYISKMFWPVDLGIYYPFRGPFFSAAQAGGAACFLLAFTYFAVRAARTRPWFTVGWFWYAGTLVPVIGLIQVGSQAMADRYTYLSLIGLFLLLAWGVFEQAQRYTWSRRCLPSAAVALVLILAGASWTQTGYWRDSTTLYQHTLRVTRPNWVIYASLGDGFSRSEHYRKAIDAYRASLYLYPENVHAMLNLADSLAKQDELEEALDYYRKVLAREPERTQAHFNLAVAYVRLGRMDEAIAQFEAVLKLDPQDENARLLLGVAREKRKTYVQPS